jgi:NitT/TauT family transport system permease protein
VSHAFAPVVVGALTLFPLLYSSTLSALQGVDKAILEMCDVYRVARKVRVRRLYLPIALPRLFSDGVAALSFALKLTVSAEVLAFTYRSVGGWMQEAALSAETATVAALTLFVCLVGVLVETLGGALARRCEVEQCD